MSVNFKQARDFVYTNGVLWERDLFAYLFQGGSLERLHHSLQSYQNADGGYGNAMEHDIRCPESHPLALEFLLGVLTQCQIPPGHLLDGTATWLEAHLQPDGSLQNPPAVLDYPHAPWWNEGGQFMPDSIVGKLHRFGCATPALLESTAQWVSQHLTLEKIRANEWLFMAYHGYDYFMNIPGYPAAYREAVIENIIQCAQAAPEKQYYTLFAFAPTPDSPVAQAMTPDLLDRYLSHLLHTQQEDGGWLDEHGLPQWRPYVTITNLLTLRNYGRLTI